MNPLGMNPALSIVMVSISVTQDVVAIKQTVTYGEFRSISAIIVNIQRAKTKQRLSLTNMYTSVLLEFQFCLN